LGISLDSLRVSVDVDDLTSAWSPGDAVDYFIRGVYAKVRIEVTLSGDALSAVDTVWAELEAGSGRDYLIEPRLPQDRYELRHQGGGTYSREIQIVSVGNVASALAGMAVPGTGGSPSLLDSTPPVFLDAVVIEGGGQDYSRSVRREIPRYFAHFSTGQMNTLQGSY